MNPRGCDQAGVVIEVGADGVRSSDSGEEQIGHEARYIVVDAER